MQYDNNYFSKVYEKTPLDEKEKVHKAHLSILKKNKKNLIRILDIGCGYGHFLKHCENNKIESYGIEISKFAIKKASKNTSAKIIHLDVSKSDFPYESNFFDAIIALDIIEHLDEKKIPFFLKNVNRVLKNKGLFYATTPNIDFLFKQILPDSDPTHINVNSKEYWKNKLFEANFHKINIKGCLLFGFPPTSVLREITPFKMIRPLFFPLTSLCQELFIMAWK